MSVIAARLGAAPRLTARLNEVSPRYVLAAIIVTEWLITLGVALTIRHNAWVYYQGGDQLWHYVTAWLMVHGHLAHTSVGYGWAMVLLPFAALGGPNLVAPLPFILLLEVIVLMPVAILATYGIGVRIGGRLFGYWACLLWLVVPLIGIRYTAPGYHQRYTELLLPQSLGLTAMSDFPSLVVGAVAAYFTLRALEDDPWDAILAGLFAGVAIGIKPSNAPLVVGMGLALLAARKWRAVAFTGAGIAPAVVALVVWKARGEGNLPLFQRGLAGPHLIVAHAAPVLAFSIHSYFHPSWTFFKQQLDSIREHFWSLRVVEWGALAGTIGLLRRSRPIGLLFGGWFFSLVLVKWTSPISGSTIDDSDLLRQTISAIPAALFIIAGLVLLYPGLPRRLRTPELRPWGSHRLRLGLVTGLVTVFAVAPTALALGLPLLSNADALSYYTQSGASLSAPFSVDSGWHPTVATSPRTVRLHWRALKPLGGEMEYRVFRAQEGRAITCDVTGGGSQCRLTGVLVAAQADTTVVDHVPAGRWDYRVVAVASWIKDPTAGDVYVAATPVDVTVPN